MSLERNDHGVLTRWLDECGLGVGLPLEIGSLSSGRSNAMFKLRRGEQRWVLRRPRKVAVERADDLMRREFQLLTALNETDVPHARAVVLCEDTRVLGNVFYLMGHVDGFNPAGPLPKEFDGAQEKVAHAMIDALATLHGVDWRAAGLTAFGRPERFHERQVSRWISQLDAYGGRPLPDLGDIGTWLDRHAPADYEPTIMHGDYHLLNLMMAPDMPARVAAIVDWETATIGDPILDVVGFLEVYRQACPPEQGWPAGAALWLRYVESTGRGVADDVGVSTSYYVALYNFRMAVLMEGIFQRSLKDSDRAPAHDVAERVSLCIRRALDAIELAKSPG